jgi:hypothetical protein
MGVRLTVMFDALATTMQEVAVTDLVLVEKVGAKEIHDMTPAAE